MASPQIINDIRLPLGHRPEDLLAEIARRSGRPAEMVGSADYRIIRQSVDARHKTAIYLQYAVELNPLPADWQGIAALLPQAPMAASQPERPCVVGAGPAGLFAALFLALAGCRPILIEQGKAVDERQADVSRFWQTGELDPYSNVQFGEGGAGTFSDGKLTTGIKDRRCRPIVEELVLAGAPPEILFLAKPHVGTDLLRDVVLSLRRKIIRNGGEVRFGCRLADLQLDKAGRLAGLVVEQRQGNGDMTAGEIRTTRLVLAIGHSSRQTIRRLAESPLALQAKPFSLGLRIEHPQDLVDRIQYGRFAGHPQLPAADYKLACHLPSGRSVYTFCMCPGGRVIAAASEPATIVTNGMSSHARSLPNANSALLVGVTPADFPEPGPLGGMAWQESLERQAYRCAGSNGRAPAERLASFAAFSRAISAMVEPTYRPGVSWCDLADCLPGLVRDALREAIPHLDRQMPGFANPGAVLTGPETRSSCPWRILRNEQLQASIPGLYPCGEGGGHAGGIMSAAADGLRCAEAVLLQT